MVIKTISIEIGRKFNNQIIVGLHPGTVDTPLSKPFQGNVPEGKLFTPKFSAEALLRVIDGLTPENSGDLFDWAGKRIEFWALAEIFRNKGFRQIRLFRACLNIQFMHKLA